jgi:polyhydroxybutyrate depolymerase
MSQVAPKRWLLDCGATFAAQGVMRGTGFSLLTLIVVLALACGGRVAPSVLGELDGRLYLLKVPSGYDGSRPLPLIVGIHAYGSDAGGLESYFQLDALADQLGFFVVYPQGTVDQSGRRFFTATDACCDFYDTGVDDVAFIGSLLDHLQATLAIDPARIYAVGHSNGGFLSHRLACDLSSRFAAVVSLEGATWNDPSRCQPTEPIAVVEVHGTDDTVINPAGGDVVDGYPDRVYPPLAQTMATWANLESCGATTHAGPDPGVIDSETSQPTTVQVWNGCRADVELWLNHGGTHVPELTPQWPVDVVGFLMAHPKPSQIVP